MARVIDVLPELAGEEMLYVQSLIKDLSNDDAQTFANVYRTRRRDPQLILITAIIGFFGVAGIHRLLTGEIALGILYIFTIGLCWIGTIVDLVNYQKLAFEYNMKIANEVLPMVRQ